jgi:hypothetical protein
LIWKQRKKNPNVSNIFSNNQKKRSSTRITHHLHLRRRQLERHGAQVIAEPLLLARRRDGHDVLLDAPPQQDLAGVDGVLFGQLGQDGVDGPAGALGDGRLGAVG